MSALLTVSENVCADVALAASVTVTVNVVVASVATGVPLTAPVDVLKLMPVGNVPPDKANPYGVVPPLAVTGVNVASNVPIVPARLATACVATSAELTVSVNVFADIAPAASVTVTVYVVTASAVAGVPLTVPVLVLKLMPVGNDAPDSANAYGVVPPLAVTGANDGISVPAVPTVLGTTAVVETATLTVSANVLADVAPAASVAVTVNVVAASVVVGVPLTAPVVVLKLMPVGNTPPVSANE